jgi:hypothetical protein
MARRVMRRSGGRNRAAWQKFVKARRVSTNAASAGSTGSSTRVPAKRRKRQEPSYLEAMLLQQILAAKLPVPVLQSCLVPGRKFRWDFYWPGHQLACEVNGGTEWNLPGHSGLKVEKDYEKLALGLIHGVSTVAFTSRMVRSGDALTLLSRLLALRSGQGVKLAGTPSGPRLANSKPRLPS